jgi:hypothetical protein
VEALKQIHPHVVSHGIVLRGVWPDAAPPIVKLGSAKLFVVNMCFKEPAAVAVRGQSVQVFQPDFLDEAAIIPTMGRPVEILPRERIRRAVLQLVGAASLQKPELGLAVVRELDLQLFS